MKRDEITLLDISKAAHLVLAFIQGMQKLEFLNDLKTQSSVLYQLLVMGEAVKRKSLFAFRKPWKAGVWTRSLSWRESKR